MSDDYVEDGICPDPADLEWCDDRASVFVRVTIRPELYEDFSRFGSLVGVTAEELIANSIERFFK